RVSCELSVVFQYVSVLLLILTLLLLVFFLFLFIFSVTSAIYSLSLHDALPISQSSSVAPSSFESSYMPNKSATCGSPCASQKRRSEEHTSELQSRFDLVCRLLLEKKKYIEGDKYTKQSTYCDVQ